MAFAKILAAAIQSKLFLSIYTAFSEKKEIKAMRVSQMLGVMILGFVTLAGAQQNDPRAEMLVKLEGEFMKAALEKGSAGYMSYYAEQSVELPDGAPAILGKENIGKTMGFLDDKKNQLTWTPAGADVSGDLGYTYGTYEFRSQGKDGKPVIEQGKYASIWKKQRDGSWKVVLDMGNSGAAEP